MARRVRELDWSRTPLGPTDQWPQSLRVAVGICLNSRFPMFVWWGEHLVNIYNDAYVPILGKRHPDALGRPARESWEEIWAVVGPQAEAVMTRGEATWNERVLLVMERHGFTEETYFTWSYSPILDEHGHVRGLFCACTEDTARVVAERERDRLAQQRQLALDAARMGWWHYDPLTRISTWDQRYAQIFGVSGNRGPNDEILRRLHPDDVGRVWTAVEGALDPRDPKAYAVEFRIERDDGAIVWVEANGVAHFEGEGAQRRATSFVGTVADVTERKRIEAERGRLVSELEAQRALLAEVFRRSPSFMAVVRGPEHVFELTNERYDELVGRRDLIGKPVREALPEVAGQGFFELLDRVYRTGEAFAAKDVPVALRRQPGQPPEERHVDFVYQPLRDVNGTITGIFAHGVDLTERKLAEAALRESEERLSAILSNAPAMVYVVDKENRVRFINRRWESVFGLTADVATGRSIYDFFPEDVADQFAANNRAVMETRRPQEAEEVVPQADGEHTYISVKVPLFDADGNAYAICGISTDITDRKRAEEALRRSEAAFRELADAMPQIVFSAGPDGEVDYFNRQWYEYTGLSEGSVGFESWKQAHTAEGLRRAMEVWPEAVRTGRPYEIEYPLRRHDGVYRWHLGRALPIRDAEGKIIRWFGTNTDIHDYKQLQEQNEQLLGSERAARVEAERASEAKSDFLATLSHELRTPLTPVLLTVSLMEMHPALPAELRNGVATIRRNVELESRLIGDLLDLTRISKGKLQLDVQDVDLHAVLRSAIDICQREASAKLVVDLRAKHHVVRGDATRLQQIFWNLVNNAQKFTPPEGTITVRSCGVGDGKHVRVEVIDTGVGVHPAVLPRLFDAFEQGEVRTARQQAGLGLGLTISKTLAEAHGGTISAHSAGRGRGATFTLELPVVDARLVEAPLPAGPIAAPGAERASMAILLVEDHEPTLRIMSKLLTQLGHRVTAVTSVASATTAARQDGYDVIISDLGLPDGSGLDVMRQLRDRYSGRAIALTGYGMESDVAASREAGFAEHLTKPVDLAALEAAIGRVTGAEG